jgi:PAS domain S-box-containing protein
MTDCGPERGVTDLQPQDAARHARQREEEERRRLMAVVQRERDTLSALIASITDEIWFADTDGHVTLVNPAAWKEFGAVDGERIETIAAAFEVYRADGTPRPPEEAPPLRALRGEVIRDEEEIVRTPAAGELRHRRVSGAPVRDDDGRIIGSVCVVRDVTHDKRTEAALRESEARLRFHLENTPLAVVEWDADFVVTRWAGEAESMFGWSAAETVGKPLGELGLVIEDDVSVVEGTMSKLTDGEHRRVVSANRNVTRDGRVIDCTWFNSVLMDEQGRMTSVMSLVQDNTERRRAETALRESEERLNLALMVGGIATWDFRVDTGEVVWNREHYLMLGYEPGETQASYEAFLARVHPEDAAAVDAAFRDSLDHSSDYVADFRIVRPDGGVRAISAVGHLEVDAGGAPLRQYGVMFDVTERIDAERALRHSGAERAAQAERSRLARDLHDSVTQALFAASLKAEALASSPDLISPAGLDMVEDVRRLSRGALAQMRTMLLELRGDPIEQVPIRHLLRNLVESAESRASVHVWLTVEGEEPLSADVHVAAYRIAQEALNNVVRHAGASDAYVELRTGPSGMELTVRDNGRGFDPAAHDPSHFGLASMLERATEVGCELSVDSTVGEGTTVVLRRHT